MNFMEKRDPTLAKSQKISIAEKMGLVFLGLSEFDLLLGFSI